MNDVFSLAVAPVMYPSLGEGAGKGRERGRVSGKYSLKLNKGNKSKGKFLQKPWGKNGQEVRLLNQREMNVQEARLLATCLVEGGSQRGQGVLLPTIQYHACHGGSHVAGCYQKRR